MADLLSMLWVPLGSRRVANIEMDQMWNSEDVEMYFPTKAVRKVTSDGRQNLTFW